MKQMILYAYSKLNLGDDLFIKILCDRYPDTKFILFTENKFIDHLSSIPNLKFQETNKFKFRISNYLFRKLKISNNYIGKKIANKADGIVYIGGSLFIQTPEWKNVLAYNKDSLIEGKPCYLLGANFGPYKDEEYYNKHREIFSKYTDICFREKYTYDKFKDLNNVRLADDIVFNHKNHSLEETRDNIVISVIKPSFRQHLIEYDEIYYQKIKEICVEFARNKYEITLMSFCQFEGDEEAIDVIIDLIPNKYSNKINKYSYRGNLQEALYQIADSKYVVATRYHSMILGFVENKPVFPIIYSSKMKNTLEDIKFKGKYIELEAIKNLDSKEVFESFESNRTNISKQIENSQNHFYELDKYLK